MTLDLNQVQLRMAGAWGGIAAQPAAAAPAVGELKPCEGDGDQ
jgi:hypothetical protein